VHYSIKFTVGLLGSTAMAIASMPAAHADAFGPATGAAEILGVPTVVTTASPSISWSDASLFWTSATGSLSSVAGTASGDIDGTVPFSATAGHTDTESIPGLLISVGGQSFTFDVSSVFTTLYSYNAATTGSISLYILGTMGGGSLSPTETSLTLTANDTTGGAWSSSFTLSNPPAPPPPPPPPPPSGVPEPASLASLGTALVALGALRRRRSRRPG